MLIFFVNVCFPSPPVTAKVKHIIKGSHDQAFILSIDMHPSIQTLDPQMATDFLFRYSENIKVLNLFLSFRGKVVSIYNYARRI